MVDLFNNENKYEQIKTVVFASFFCDISLKDSIQIGYRTEDSISCLWVEADKKLIMEHAYRAAKIVSQYKEAPPLAYEIVKQHHGAIDGKSLPTIFSEDLLPLSKCLIAAQELAYEILKKPKIPVVDIVSYVTNKYIGTPLFAPLEAFKNFCRK